MVDKNLVELGKYAEEIQNKKPIELIDEYLKNIDTEMKNISEESNILGDKFGNDLVRIIDKYKMQGISDVLVSYHLLSLLVSYIKCSLIEEKAAILNIEKNLYKNDMRFLFKGKT
jgi:hypothetical protein